MQSDPFSGVRKAFADLQSGLLSDLMSKAFVKHPGPVCNTQAVDKKLLFGSEKKVWVLHNEEPAALQFSW